MNISHILCTQPYTALNFSYSSVSAYNPSSTIVPGLRIFHYVSPCSLGFVPYVGKQVIFIFHLLIQMFPLYFYLGADY